MTAIGFDTLSASRRLREAGMDERVAEAVVELVQQTARMPDMSELATKTELSATRGDMNAEFAAVRSEMTSEFAAVRSEMKSEFAAVRSEMALMESRLRADLSEKIRLQGWALLGGVAVLMTISTALIKLVP